VEGGGEELWVMVAAVAGVVKDWVVNERNSLWDGLLYVFRLKVHHCMTSWNNMGSRRHPDCLLKNWVLTPGFY
jgi:hypothetical protein